MSAVCLYISFLLPHKPSILSLVHIIYLRPIAFYKQTHTINPTSDNGPVQSRIIVTQMSTTKPSTSSDTKVACPMAHPPKPTAAEAESAPSNPAPNRSFTADSNMTTDSTASSSGPPSESRSHRRRASFPPHLLDRLDEALNPPQRKNSADNVAASSAKPECSQLQCGRHANTWLFNGFSIRRDVIQRLRR